MKINRRQALGAIAATSLVGGITKASTPVPFRNKDYRVAPIDIDGVTPNFVRVVDMTKGGTKRQEVKFSYKTIKEGKSKLVVEKELIDTAEFPKIVVGDFETTYSYHVPNHGYMAELRNGEHAIVPSYRIGAAVDWKLGVDLEGHDPGEMIRDALIKKLKNDIFHTLICGGYDRNIVCFDNNKSGRVTRELMSLMKEVMRRNGKGNAISLRRNKLTDIYVGEDAACFGDSKGAKLWAHEGVRVHRLEELNEGGEYQQFYLDQCGGTLPSNASRLIIGVDNTQDSFVLPYWGHRISYHNEPNNRKGIRLIAKMGFCALDNRTILLGAI